MRRRCDPPPAPPVSTPDITDDIEQSTAYGRRFRAADTELLVSPFDGAWWRTTKRMIERGAARFWAKRGGDPGAMPFNSLKRNSDLPTKP